VSLDIPPSGGLGGQIPPALKKDLWSMFETPSRETTPKDQQTKTVKRFKLRNNSFCAVTSPLWGAWGASAMMWILGPVVPSAAMRYPECGGWNAGHKRHMIARVRLGTGNHGIQSRFRRLENTTCGKDGADAWRFCRGRAIVKPANHEWQACASFPPTG